MRAPVPPPTTHTTIVKQRAAPQKKKKRKLKVSKKMSKTSSVVTGPRNKSDQAGAPQDVSERSETMTIAFLGFGTILLLTAGLYAV